ncbi:MAG: HigA family addiction module antidote protein [Elusimicrobia bacterium]|nr:HigA family addiction module antidote protein [Elusimicrobiota bacterium]
MIPNKRPPTHPGGILKRHYLEPLSLAISRAAAALGVSRKTVSKIVNERGDITPDMALRLAKAFGTTPELWLNLQRNYDLWHASHDSHSWQRVRAIGPHSSHSSTSNNRSAWAF